jgi:hypothetical protein
MRSYMIPHAIPPKYIGVTMDQSTMPATADQPSMAPQLNVRAGDSGPTLSDRRRGGLTEKDLGVVGDSFHEWVHDYETQ